MSYHVTVERAAQLLACLMRLKGEKPVNRMWALKMLYLADRESIDRYGMPLTGDRPVAMRHGPVLSKIYDWMKEGVPEGEDPETDIWRAYFTKEGEYDIRLIRDPGNGELSEDDEQIIQKVFELFGDKDQFELKDICHKHEEWRNNERGNTSVDIPLRDILFALGKSEEEVRAAIEQRREALQFDRLFGTAC